MIPTTGKTSEIAKGDGEKRTGATGARTGIPTLSMSSETGNGKDDGTRSAGSDSSRLQRWTRQEAKALSFREPINLFR